ncbi:LrgB family protein [Kordiimonas sp.]|uniref:LrgB family protein n=1 Tax=Kordiimonas sp. TaxID=1970157 RepID=UPI003A91E551
MNAVMPVLWFFTTITLFALADLLYRRTGGKAWAHPTLMPTLVLILVFTYTDFDFTHYQIGTRIFDLLLGAAVAALAVPLFRSRKVLATEKQAVFAATAAGSLMGVGSALCIALLLRSPADMVASVATKSVTTPIAVVVAPSIGGVPGLAAAVVIVTGLVIAIFGPPFLKMLGIEDDIEKGVALGTAGHAIGMAEAVRRSELMGAAAAFSMASNGLVTALLLPIIWPQ